MIVHSHLRYTMYVYLCLFHCTPLMSAWQSLYFIFILMACNLELNKIRHKRTHTKRIFFRSFSAALIQIKRNDVGRLGIRCTLWEPKLYVYILSWRWFMTTETTEYEAMAEHKLKTIKCFNLWPIHTSPCCAKGKK